jgi:hypothetical protein
MKKSSLWLVALALVLLSCSKDPNVPELEQAARSVEQMVAPLNAPRISFFVVLPNGTPRQFVSWFFSQMGSADRPPVDEPSEFSQDELDAMRQSGMALTPKGIYFRHSHPDTALQKQLVLKWDDAEGTVILEGYLDPRQQPAYTTSFKLPKDVVPGQAAQMIVQSNLDMGMRFQSF